MYTATSFTFNVLTWNIKIMDAFYTRYQTIAKQICESNADVVCLQEISVIGWHYMCDILQNQYVPVFDSPLRANSTYRTYGEMILLKHESFTLSNKGFFLLPSKMGRSVQWACIENACGEKCVIATGHLESGLKNQEFRSQQWKKIESEFSGLTEPFVWVGDVNMECSELGPTYGKLVSFGDTYFGHRFGYEGKGAYDRAWTVKKNASLLNRMGIDSDGLELSDHDGLLIQISS